MKKYIYFLLLFPTWVLAQIAPSSEKPYIRVSTPRIATSTESVLDDYTKAINTIQYMDGSGRPMQTVGYKTSPTGQDMLMETNTLDQVGRIKRSYLPVQGSLSNGSYQANATTLAETFYGDTAPYSEVETYEASPFSRPLKTVGAGQAFRTGTPIVSKGSTEHIYTAGAGIRKYFVNEDANGNVTSVNGSAAFADGDLLMRQSTDEDNHSIKIFTDREGRTIEQWQIAPNGTTLKTAYIYDDVSRLRYVIPPKAYDLASIFDETVTPNTSYFNESIYAFRYDERGRLVEKHVPGGGWHYTVYNELDQAIMSQNPRQRESGLWEWVRYDGHGRVVMSGTWISGASRVSIQDYFLNFLADNQFEERSTASGNVYGYTSRSFPSAFVFLASDVKKVLYYDDYSWVNNTSLDFLQYQTPQWSNAKGLATGSMIRKLDSGVFLKSVAYYDDKNRVIQAQTENRFGAINQSDFVLNFAGDLLEERTIYHRPSKADLIVSTKYTYDHIGRKTGAVHYLNGKPTPLAQYKHDGIGRVIQKRLMQAGNDIIVESSPQPNGDQDIANRYVLLTTGTITAQNGNYLACIAPNVLQVIDFAYNIRGQLRSINNGILNTSEGDVFAMQLDYHEDNRFFNGLLSKQTWNSLSQSTNRGFTYNYDGFLRLNEGLYSGVGSENYSVSGITYDANGNISTLQRNGLTGANTWGQIDNLGYNYLTASNRLSYIQENSLANKGFKDNGGTSDFTYYSDGSLKSDNNRGITLIDYNYLGLPDKIHFGATKHIENVYDAEGMKLSQKLINGSSVITTDYMGDLIYRNDSLKTIQTDEGRVAYKMDGSYGYQFFITDHLGNTRAIIERLNANTAFVQENHYGAWGEILEGIGQSGDWLFLFQGKEFVDGVGYDFGARQYDAWRGQFDAIDPVDNYSLGGFVGMMNNPNSFIDPDGRDPVTLGVAVGAALVGGGLNLWSNWSKIKGFKQGLAYFGSGAAGGLATVFSGGNAALGGGITAAGNVAIDIATGNVPSLKRPQDYAQYIGEEVGKGIVFGYVGGQVGKFIGPKLGSLFGWMQQGFSNNVAGSAVINGELIEWAGEAGVKATYGKLGSSIGSSVAKQGFKKAATNLNTNASKGNFGIYEIVKDGQLYKYGKADLGRITQSSGNPTRLHQQLRKLEELFPNSQISGKVIEDLGQVTTKTAKAVENSYLNFYYKTTGIIPEGNLKSFFPR
jgi:RHS repeat-associated protein